MQIAKNSDQLENLVFVIVGNWGEYTPYRYMIGWIIIIGLNKITIKIPLLNLDLTLLFILYYVRISNRNKIGNSQKPKMCLRTRFFIGCLTSLGYKYHI